MMSSRSLQIVFSAVMFMGGSFNPVLVQAQTAGPADFTELVERTGPAVVSIRTSARIGSTGAQGQPEIDENDPLYEFFRRFFPQQQPGPQGRQQPPGPSPRSPRGGGGEREVPRGLGSGFLISADGYLLTNHHVVDGADDITVSLQDKREFKGKLIGSDQRTDVALIKIDATNLPVLHIGDPARLKVGEWVIAIGSPFALQNTVTAGIVSAKARETGELLPFIQTDVAVNPGNSGGPLINMRGEAIGINSQIFTTSGAYAGISFAIPIDEAMRVSDLLKTQGKVVRGRIGVGISDLTREVAESIGLARAAGAQVTSVERSSPADTAGIEPGDVIIKFNNKPIETSNELRRAVADTRPGSKVNLSVWRKGASRDLQVTVGEMQTEPARARNDKVKPNAPVANAVGLAVVDVPAERLKELRLPGAVQVEVAEGAAGRAGFRPGDLILSLNNVDIKNAKQFNEVVSKLDLKRNIPVLVRRIVGDNDQSQFLIIRPAER